MEIGKCKRQQAVSEDELNRRADSILRIVREKPGLSAAAIGRRLGAVPEREVRERIARLRKRGEPITIGSNAVGYYHLDDILDPAKRADIVKAHRNRSAAYMVDHARLMRQVGKMTAVEIAQASLFDLLIPDDPEEASTATRPSTMADLARLPRERRAGVTRLLVALLDGLENDAQAFAYERALLADRFKGVFLTKIESAKLAQARKLLEEVGV